METVAPGINEITVTVLGVSDVYLQNRSDAFCGSGGALQKQYEAVRKGRLTSRQPGIGWYSLAAATWQQQEHAQCLSRLNHWWHGLPDDTSE
jgi:hypothetical protein